MDQKKVQKLIRHNVRMAQQHVKNFDKLSKKCEHNEVDPPFGMMCKKHDDGELWGCDIRTCPLWS